MTSSDGYVFNLCVCVRGARSDKSMIKGDVLSWYTAAKIPEGVDTI